VVLPLPEPLIAAPYAMPASALGKDGATAPSDRICMGFVGLGGQGGGHLFGGDWTYLPGGYLGRDDVQVLGVCDVQRKRAEGAKGRVEQHYADRSDKGTYAGGTRTVAVLIERTFPAYSRCSLREPTF